MDDTAFASATRLAGEIRDRRIGCLELLDLFVARAERFNPALIEFARLLAAEIGSFAPPPGY